MRHLSATPSRRGSARFLLAALLAGATATLAASPLCAQDRPFLFTVTTGSDAGFGARTLLSGDLGYGRRSFRSVAPERAEQSVTAQIALGSRVTVLARTGLAFADPSATSTVSAQGEVLAGLLPADAAASLFVGVGGLRDYAGTAVFLGRVGAGFSGARWEAAGNLRLEHAFVAHDGTATEAPRDGVDLITTAGVARRSGSVRLGVEAVAEDLEGFFDREEAEGGAKLMIGPTVRWAPEGSRWQLLVGGGPVLRLTQSVAVATGGAPRELTGGSGYVLRTAVGYRW
jgi:hypothetical protein